MKLLITGHNEFSIGIQSALAMIAGELEGVVIIPFLAEETVDEYRQKVAAEIQMFDQAICFTDLLDGTPSKTYVEFSEEEDQVFVVSGINLGMLLEGLMIRNNVTDSFEIAKTVVQAGKSNIMFFEKNNEIEELPEEEIQREVARYSQSGTRIFDFIRFYKKGVDE